MKLEGQVSVVGVAGLRSYDQYGDEAHAKRANRKDFVELKQGWNLTARVL